MTRPYELTNTPEGLYTFTTDNGDIYYCRFRNCAEVLSTVSPVLGIYDIDVYEFEFLKGDTTNPAVTDKRVAQTVSELLFSFFDNSLRVIIYLCDEVDGKQAGRNRLFENWHRAYLSHHLQRVPVHIEIEQEETGTIKTVYACGLIRPDFPHLEVFKQEIRQAASELLNLKYQP